MGENCLSFTCISPLLDNLIMLIITHKNTEVLRESTLSVLLNHNNRPQGQTDSWREFIRQLLSLLLYSDTLAKRMWDLVKALDYKIDLATIACFKIWTFGSVLILMMFQCTVLSLGGKR